jgi:chemotaxis protein CheX
LCVFYGAHAATHSPIAAAGRVPRVDLIAKVGAATMIDETSDIPETTASDCKAIVLPSVLDLLAADALRSRLVAAVGDRVPFVVAAGDVVRMSTPCAQVLLAAARTAETAGISVRIDNASEDFIDALDDLGLRGTFEKWMS